MQSSNADVDSADELHLVGPEQMLNGMLQEVAGAGSDRRAEVRGNLYRPLTLEATSQQIQRFLYCKLMSSSWKSHVVLSGSIEHALLASAPVDRPRTRRQLLVIATEASLRLY